MHWNLIQNVKLYENNAKNYLNYLSKWLDVKLTSKMRIFIKKRTKTVLKTLVSSIQEHKNFSIKL